ncbi:MAG: ATP-dependent helicase, partial [Gammaproteobacteria bacterium]|nr:ATP-dependent helicase [Gammaproteobacteria bacterium]NNJ84854.1 ATP-dependent helicase [Gammaproteobacteria bacterium]
MGSRSNTRTCPARSSRWIKRPSKRPSRTPSVETNYRIGNPVTTSEHNIALRLTPQGNIVLDEIGDSYSLAHSPAHSLDNNVAERLSQAFARGSGHGLMQLGAGEAGRKLPPVLGWWRDFAARYVGVLCLRAQDDAFHVPPPSDSDLASLVLTAPLMPGEEYLSIDVLRGLWTKLGAAFTASLAQAGTDLQSFLRGLNPVWNLVGRVHFNLAENRRDPELPFAFMATYTTRLSAEAKAQHVPLGQALREYSGVANRDKLLSLLLPVQRAAERCDWLKAMVDAGEIFHPLRWSPFEASQFLASVPDLESAGVVVRMPATWRANRPARPRVSGTVGVKAPSVVGLDGLMDFRMDVMLDGEPLNNEEIATLLSGTDSLVLLRGQWVEIDRDRMERTMEQFQEAERLAAESGLTFAEAMRMLAGATLTDASGDRTSDADWSQVTAGPWLAETLKALRNPDGNLSDMGNGAGIDPGSALKGELRPYQKAGVEWLHLLSGLGLGACLADDMGLGKTIQVLSLLLVQGQKDGLVQGQEDGSRQPSILVAPASLLANWATEIERFAPKLK